MVGLLSCCLLAPSRRSESGEGAFGSGQGPGQAGTQPDAEPAAAAVRTGGEERGASSAPGTPAEGPGAAAAASEAAVAASSSGAGTSSARPIAGVAPPPRHSSSRSTADRSEPAGQGTLLVSHAQLPSLDPSSVVEVDIFRLLEGLQLGRAVGVGTYGFVLRGVLLWGHGDGDDDVLRCAVLAQQHVHHLAALPRASRQATACHPLHERACTRGPACTHVVAICVTLLHANGRPRA